jgi:type IV fimbrial biogenesis protein FimT
MSCGRHPPCKLAKGNVPGGSSGFTLIELATVLVVTGILAAFAIPSFNYLIATNRAKSAAGDLHIALLKTRSEALKRNASVTLAPVAAGWESGWQIKDAGNVVLETYAAVKDGVTIANGPVSVVYQSSGRIQGSIAAAFLITGSGRSNTRRCVSVATSGRPYLKSLAGGATCP